MKEGITNVKFVVEFIAGGDQSTHGLLVVILYLLSKRFPRKSTNHLNKIGGNKENEKDCEWAVV